MEWNKNESSRKASYYADAGDTPRSDAMVELWQVFTDDVLPRNEYVDWDYVKIEIWSDAGRVIVFPASSLSKWRIEKASCDVTFSDLLASYDELADAEIDDDMFEEQIAELHIIWACELERTARASRLSDVRISIFSAEEPGPFGEFSIP